MLSLCIDITYLGYFKATDFYLFIYFTCNAASNQPIKDSIQKYLETYENTHTNLCVIVFSPTNQFNLRAYIYFFHLLKKKIQSMNMQILYCPLLH